MSKPWLVGITGGIGAGKTIVSRIFQILGAPIYDADSRAKWLMENNQDLVDKIINLFGPQAFVNKKLDRVYLARTVFNDPAALAALNALVHPAVALDFESWVGKQEAVYIIKEAALLIESGSYQTLDSLIVVTAPENLRVNRVLARDSHRTAEDLRSIMDKQLADEDKLSKANYVIHNDESSLLIPQVTRLHDLFKAKK